MMVGETPPTDSAIKELRLRCKGLPIANGPLPFHRPKAKTVRVSFKLRDRFGGITAMKHFWL